jgi:hypothetical protein
MGIAIGDTIWKAGSTVGIEGVPSPMIFSCAMSAKVVDAIDGSATVYFVGKNRSKSQFTMTLEAFLNQQPDVNDDDADDVDLDSAISFASAKYNGENACRAHNNRRCVLIICLSLHMSLSNMQ